MDITSEIQKAINNNLPQAVGDELKQELGSLAALRKDQSAWVAEKKQLQASILRLTEENQQFKNLESDLSTRANNIALREEAVRSRELACAITEATNLAEVHKARAETALEAMRLMMRNTEVRKSIDRVEVSAGVVPPSTTPGYGSMSGFLSTQPTPVKETETTTEA